MHAVTDHEPADLSAFDVCREVGITYRQLDYWIRTGAIRPAVEATGSGTQRRFTPNQVRAVRLAAALRGLGAPMGTIAGVVGRWAEMPEHEWAGLLIVNQDGTTGPEAATAGWVLDLEALAATG